MQDVRRGMLVGLVLLTLAVVAPLVVRWALSPRGPAVEIELPSGATRTVPLSALRRFPTLTRQGEYQNQFGNWRDAGTYSGVRLSDLFAGVDYEAVEVVAEDGYRLSIERARVENPDYPIVLAYAKDGVAVPEWEDGLRIAVLPVDGRVSNDEYSAVSAGGYWVKNVARLIVH
ncbi:MAG: hypothetical protein PHV11_02780 [Candidatus Bipolaricaulis sp.]|nr:hypothetical protein [Candidatus Bipolaricaulis sp.]